jgi:hypothetical protein
MRTVFIRRHPTCRAKNGRSRHFEFCRSGPIAEVTDLMKHCGYRGRRDSPICLSGRNVMDWFSQKTSIAGIQIPNWGIVLGAVIVILLIYMSMH